MLSHKLTTSVFLSNCLRSREKYRLNNKLADDGNIGGVCQWRMYLRIVSRKNSEKFMLSLPVFVTSCCVTKYSKMKLLKTTPVYCLEFCGSRIWARPSWVVPLLRVWLARATHLNFSTRTSAGPRRSSRALLACSAPAAGPRSPPQLLFSPNTWQAFSQQSACMLRGEARPERPSRPHRQASLVALHFIALHRYCFLVFFLQIESLWQPCIE